MIASMTGYGKASDSSAAFSIEAEIKSLNSKGLDINIRMSSFARSTETRIRKRIQEKLFRGKIDLSLNLTPSEDIQPNALNIPLLKKYLLELRQLADNMNIEGDLMSAALRLPDVINPQLTELDAETEEKIMLCVDAAIAQLEAFRLDEGQAMEADLRTNADSIRTLLKQTEAYEMERKERLYDRFQSALSEMENYDANRLEQEMIFYVEKLDINEEKVRLTQHLDYFLDQIGQVEYVGRKLNFISQEMGREINTLGSKAQHAEIQKIVVQMKDKLEQIKEQILNIV